MAQGSARESNIKIIAAEAQPAKQQTEKSHPSARYPSGKKLALCHGLFRQNVSK